MDAFERNRRRLEENQRRLDALRMQNNKPAPTERPKQSFFNKVRDQFDANTASDQYRRQQAGDARLYSQQQKDRGIGRVANNPWERTLNLGKSIGESVYATPKRLGQAVEEVVNGNKTQQSFNQLNQTNQKVLSKVNARLANPNLTPAERNIQEDIRQKMIRLQRQGFDEQRKEFSVAADKLDPKKNAAAVADAALTIASAGVAGVAMKTAGQTAAKLGYRAAARQAAPAFFKNMGLNTAQGVTDTVANIGEGRQAGWKDIAKGGAVGATVGSVADVGLGLIPGVIGKRQYDKLLKDLASETDAGIVKQTVAAVNKNLPDEAVDNLSNDIAKAGTPDEVNKLLNEAADAEASVATKAVGNTVDNPTAPKPETPAIPNTAVTPEIVQGFKQAKTPQQARDAVKALFPELDETTANKVIQDLAQAKDDKTITQILEQAQTRRKAVTEGVQNVTPQAEALPPTTEQQIAQVAQEQPQAQLTSKQAPDADIQANQVVQSVDEAGAPVNAVQDAVAPLADGERYTTTNADVSFGSDSNGGVVSYKPDGAGTQAKQVSYNQLSDKTRTELVTAENNYAKARANSKGPVAPGTRGEVQIAKGQLDIAQSNAIEELGLQDYANKVDSSGNVIQKTYNDRYTDWAEAKYKSLNPDEREIFAKDAKANPEKYKAQFEAESRSTNQTITPETQEAADIVVPQAVTNAETLSGQFQKQAADKDANYINYLKKVEKETGQTGLVDQFYYDSGLQRRSNSIANATAKNSQNLTGAFEGLTGKSKQEFDRYVELRNEIANANRGLKTRESLDNLVAQEQALAGKYGNRFESLNNYYKEWATKLREGGLIDEPTYQSFVQNNDYTHIQRVMDDIAGYTGSTGGNSMSLGTTKAKLKRTGSQRAIQPADITALNYGQKMQSEIQRNKTASDMIDVLVGQGQAKQVPADQAARKNTIRRIVDGKTEIYQVPRDIKEIADNITPFQLGTLGKIVAAPQRVLRAGATGLSAPFTAANYVKDQIGSAVFSKNVAATHLDPRNALSGLWNATRDTLGESNNPLWKKFIESSGDTTGYDFLRNAKDAARMSKEVRLGKKGKYVNMVTAPIRTLEELNAITEKATRFQNFKGVYESALKRTNNEAEALREATLAAWQNSVDFSRMGNTAQAINLLIPYFNAGIQGTRLLGRRFGEAPVGTTMKTLGFVALPMTGLTLYNLSDEKRKAVYDNISDYEKENNLIIVLPNAEQKADGSYDGVIKVPLQQGLTNLAQPFRMQAENFAGKSTPNEVAQMAQQFFGAFAGPVGTGSLREAAGSVIPQVVKPFVQQGMNKDLFTGKEIVPDYINEATDAQGNNVAEKDKAYKFTSGTARAIGGKLGVSPLRVEKFIKDVTAKTGLYALNATDNALAKLGKIPEEQIGGISVKDDIIRRFARAQGTYNYKKSEGGKYYDRVKDATKSLNGNEKAAWDSIHPSKTNFLGEDIFDENKRLAKYTKAGLYLQHPKVFEAERAIEMEQRKQGSPANPLYDLPKEQLAKVLLKDALPPGAKDDELSNLFKQEWYQDFKNKQSAYYTQLKQKLEASGKTMPVSDNPYPVTSPELQKHMDYYSSLPKGTGARSSFIKGNPKIWASMTSQWQATDDWENKERVKIGLNPITNDQSSSSSGGGKGKFGKKGSGGSGGKKKDDTPKTYIGQLLGDVPSVSSNEISIKTTPKRAKLKVKTPSGKGRNYKKIKLG